MRAVGRTAFWLGWPVLYFFLSGSRRSRVVIAVDDQILVTKSWLGDGNWELPGGGAHKGEDILECALREVKEETDITLEANQLIHGDGFSISSNKISFTCEPFFVRLSNQPAIKPQKAEVADLKWVQWAELDKNNTESASLRIIAGFKRKSLL